MEFIRVWHLYPYFGTLIKFRYFCGPLNSIDGGKDRKETFYEKENVDAGLNHCPVDGWWSIYAGWLWGMYDRLYMEYGN